MAGHIDRHSGAQLHRVFHHLLIGLRCLFKVLHAGIQDDWQRLRIVIDMFGQRLVDFHQTGTVWLYRNFDRFVDDIHPGARRDFVIQRLYISIAQADTA